MSSERILITGGAGFIGTNLADRLATSGTHVTIYDNLSRSGVDQNLSWLRDKHGSRIQVEQADIRDVERLSSAVSNVDAIYHLAAQVAVTTSLENPVHDYEVNLGGTINLLEAVRSRRDPPSVVFTSTNKVYGSLPDVKLRKDRTRYVTVDARDASGINEQRPLEFHSPYGCSKGAADQYVLDYARSFGIKAVVFRMSCIYGPHQMGTEDQGWVAHFLIRALKDETVTICGDGFQVRDILFIEDLVDAFLLAKSNMNELSGEAFNIGGGSASTTSLLELLDLIEGLQQRPVNVAMDQWRVGDQRFYVSDTEKFRTATGWNPKVRVREGVCALYRWLTDVMRASAETTRRTDAVLTH